MTPTSTANVKGFNKKNKQHLEYPNIPSAIRPIPHSDEILVPIFTKLPDDVKDECTFSMSLSASNDKEKEDIAHEAWVADRVFLYKPSELNDPIQDLNLP